MHARFLHPLNEASRVLGQHLCVFSIVCPRRLCTMSAFARHLPDIGPASLFTRAVTNVRFC